MLHDLITRLRAAVIGSVLMAVAAGVAVVAAGYAVYAGLSLSFMPPAAAGLTALVFAVLAAIVGLVLMQAFKPAPKPAHRGGPSPLMLTVLSLVTDFAASRREHAKEKARHAKKARR